MLWKSRGQTPRKQGATPKTELNPVNERQPSTSFGPFLRILDAERPPVIVEQLMMVVAKRHAEQRIEI